MGKESCQEVSVLPSLNMQSQTRGSAGADLAPSSIHLVGGGVERVPALENDTKTINYGSAMSSVVSHTLIRSSSVQFQAMISFSRLCFPLVLVNAFSIDNQRKNRFSFFFSFFFLVLFLHLSFE